MVPLQTVTGTCYLTLMSITGNEGALAETLSQQYSIPGGDWTTTSSVWVLLLFYLPGRGKEIGT